MRPTPNEDLAVVIGANGGIGRALCAALSARGQYGRVVGVARDGGGDVQGMEMLRYDPATEAGIAALGAEVAAMSPRLVIIATGLLAPPSMAPEKSIRDFDADRFIETLRVNTILPALLLKHLMAVARAPGRRVLCALSARVGSISDNRLGGWHSYRASKAALNMLIRNAAIEAQTRNPDAIIVGLHPGTVATALSQPFLKGVPAEKLFSPEDAARRLLDVIDTLAPAQSGLCIDYAGKVIAP